MHILYKLTFSSGKSYIGQTVRALPIRINAHRAQVRFGSLLPVHCAWRLYGDPEIVVLAEFETHDDLHAAEIAAISEHRTITPNGYNVSIGGDTSPSKNPSVAAKIAEKAKGRKLPAEFKERFSEAARKKWESEEYREKVSDGLRASWTDDKRMEAAERMRRRWEDKKASGWEGHSEETKAKISAKARNMSAETRAKMSAAAKGKPKAPRSAETRAKIAENSRRQAQDPELMARRKAAISAALKAKFANMTDEERERMIEVKKAAGAKRKANAAAKRAAMNV